MTSLINVFRQYIQAYAAKDLGTIAELFADNIHLRDWKISVKGKSNAIAETQKNFLNADRIEIEILQTYSSPAGVAGELKIVVDQTEVLYVVDVLSFDDQGKISAIRAFLGRED